MKYLAIKPKPFPLISVVLIAATTYAACRSSIAWRDHKRPKHWAKAIYPATNLYQVDTHFFRSKQPNRTDILRLHELGINTIINMRMSNPDATELALSRFALLHMPFETWEITTQILADVLWQIELAQQRGNVLLHCFHGADRTGLVTAMYRIIYQDWAADDAQQEMKYGGFGFHPVWVNIDQFFNGDKIAEIRQHLNEHRKMRRALRIYSEQNMLDVQPTQTTLL
jgi:protein tyrosine phosphatase (PTP) superfamily phosphohydrolase (DUF442 family)